MATFKRLKALIPAIWISSEASAFSRDFNHQEEQQKAFFVFIYHPIPDMGFFHLPCMLFRASLCVSSPLATISFKCLSCAFITSSAVFPWNGASHGPPICLHVIVFIRLTSFHSVTGVLVTSAGCGPSVLAGRTIRGSSVSPAVGRLAQARLAGRGGRGGRSSPDAEQAPPAAREAQAARIIDH